MTSFVVEFSEVFWPIKDGETGFLPQTWIVSNNNEPVVFSQFQTTTSATQNLAPSFECLSVIFCFHNKGTYLAPRHTVPCNSMALAERAIRKIGQYSIFNFIASRGCGCFVIHKSTPSLLSHSFPLSLPPCTFNPRAFAFLSELPTSPTSHIGGFVCFLVSSLAFFHFSNSLEGISSA